VNIRIYLINMCIFCDILCGLKLVKMVKIGVDKSEDRKCGLIELAGVELRFK